MQLLPPITITGAVGPLVSPSVSLGFSPRNLTIQGTFTYGSGGTTVDGYVQTTLDGGLTWTDIAQFHFTTASERRIFNLSANTPETIQITPGEGALTANTAQDGVLGPQFRVKYRTTGTYAGGTTFRVDLQSQDISANPS